MTLDSESFLALCRQLRKLGATRVSGYGFEAEFASKSLPAQVSQPAQAGLVQALPRKPSRSPAPTAAGAVPERLTPERVAELREAAYAKELGR